MGYRFGTCLSLLMVSGVVLAQTSAPAPSSSVRSTVLLPASVQDNWNAPASASSSAGDRFDNKPAPAKEHFKFKERKKPAYVTDGPGNPVNKSQVLGTGKQTWEDGRPPVDCSIPPLSPACKP